MNAAPVEFTALNAEAMEALGARLAPACRNGARIYLDGDLGAGKTTLVRGLLRGLGHAGTVKSPTYTLIEPYNLSGVPVFHLDLYRLSEAGDIEWLGIRDLLETRTVLLVEWAERARSALPVPDISVALTHLESGRALRFIAHGQRGAQILTELNPPAVQVSDS